jgi:hypothetical protein
VIGCSGQGRIDFAAPAVAGFQVRTRNRCQIFSPTRFVTYASAVSERDSQRPRDWRRVGEIDTCPSQTTAGTARPDRYTWVGNLVATLGLIIGVYVILANRPPAKDKLVVEPAAIQAIARKPLTPQRSSFATSR